MRLTEIDPVRDLLDRLRLDTNARSRGAVITEGSDDVLVLSAVTGMRRSSFFPVGGRNNVLRCSEALGLEHLKGVICVADRDFDREEADHPGEWWLVFCDDADLEAMLLGSICLDRFLEIWAVAEKLEAAGGVTGVRAKMREEVAPLSALRTANARDGLGLRFDHVDLAAIFEKKTGTLKQVSLVARLAAISEMSREGIEEALATTPKVCPQTGLPLARGKDMMTALSVFLRFVIGSLSSQQVKGQFVQKSMYLGASPGDLKDTAFLKRFEDALARAA